VNTHNLQGLKGMDLVMGYPCNVRCTFCHQADYSSKRVLDRRIWSEALLPAYEVVQGINIQGGEPTVSEDCRELMQLLLDRYSNVGLSIMTNGVKFEGIFQEIYLERGRFVNFSLNAVDKPVYDTLMVGSDHQRVFTNLERFLDDREKTGSSVVVCASMVVTRTNLNQIAPMIRYCREKKIKMQITLDYVLSITVDLKSAQAAISEGYHAAEGAADGEVVGLTEFDWLLAMSNKVKPVRERFATEDRKRPAVCQVPLERLFVDFEGTCQVCCLSWYPVGNLKKQSLAEIWNGERLNRFRERMKNGDYRDCGSTCIHNPFPTNLRTAQMRKVAFKVSRDPWLYLKKTHKKWKVRSSLRNPQVENVMSRTSPPM